MDRAASLRVPANLSMLVVIRHFVEQAALALDVDPALPLDMVQAVDEVATNIVEHGYRGAPGVIEVVLWRDDHALVVQVRDQAPPFDPTRVPPPDLALPLEQRIPGGLGVHLVRRLTDEMTYRVTPQGGNELTLVKKIA